MDKNHFYQHQLSLYCISRFTCIVIPKKNFSPSLIENSFSFVLFSLFTLRSSHFFFLNCRFSPYRRCIYLVLTTLKEINLRFVLKFFLFVAGRWVMIRGIHGGISSCSFIGIFPKLISELIFRSL